ncbi:MAG: T9SS C-terminal target domain-containing protein [Flavobacteriales bacterium]|nr:T9SS C-terminal target domain-containing protein [Flavobacteriales bacterium]NCA19680.1 T9SS C-terminal target domain-containing protein [Crocinitomicaceae bacterium]
MKNYYTPKLKIFAKLFSLLLLTGTWFSANAQVPSRYALSISNGTYTPISTASGATSVAAVVGDDVFGNITGLTGFPFAGSTFTNFQASSNGRLSLYTTTAPTSTTTYNSLSTSITNAAAVLAPFAQDLVSVAGTTFLYQTIGNEHVFQWENYSRKNTSVNDVLNFQIRLNTVTGTVSYVYGTMTPGSSTTNPQIGMRTTTSYPDNVNNLLLNVTGSPTTCNWSNVVTGVAGNSSVYFNTANSSVAPTSGLTYTWTPQNSVDRVTTFSAASAITSTGATLSWTAPTGATQYNVQYRALGACSWTNWSGNPVTGTTVALTGLNVATTYQIRVQSSNGTNAPIYSQIPNQAGSGSGYIAAGTFTTLTEPCAGNPNTPTISTSATNTCSNLASTFTSTGIAPNGITGLTYQWKVSQTAGGPYTNITGATNGSSYTTSSFQTPGTYYYVLETTCSNSTLTSLSNEIAVSVNGATVSSSPANFCGTGGSGTINIVPSSATNSVTWSSLTSTATINGSGNSASYTASETSDFQATISFTNGLTCNTFISIGVYPLPAATVTTTANGVCPGTAATINSGLSAGNFASSCLAAPTALSTPPANATTLILNGVAQTLPSGVSWSNSLDDGKFGPIPMGFDFNFFGSTQNTLNIGTNGVVNFGPYASFDGTQYIFTGGFPNAVNPANTIAVCARDMRFGTPASFGTLRYWVEGYAPNRRFIVQYENVPVWSGVVSVSPISGFNNAEAVFYETLGNIDIRVVSATNGTNVPNLTTPSAQANLNINKYIGLQDGTQTIGATAPNCTTNAVNYWNGQSAEITSPQAWRFSPPSNYSTTWSATDVNGTTQLATGTNIFSQAVSPSITTTYSISYTNQTTGCTNAPNSAQVVMSVLGNVAPSGVVASSSVSTTCSGISFSLSTDYTGSSDGLTYQWQVSTNNGLDFTDILGATSLTYSATQTVASVYRLKIVACGGTPSYSSNATVALSPYFNCYCVPTISSGCTDGDVIARVILNTLDNNSGTGCPSSNGYSDYTSSSALTTTLQAASNYNCTVYAGQYSEGYAAWIDYNDDGIFDNATERIGYSNGQVTGSGTVGVLGSSATFPINLSCTPPAGQHRLRVRAMFAIDGINVTPCTDNFYGEVEDYLITIAPAPACPTVGAISTVTTGSYSADLSFPLGCSNATNFDFEYGPVGFTIGSGTQVLNQAATITLGTATYTLTGLNPLTTYDIYVRANCGSNVTSTWSITPTIATTLEPPCSGTPNTAVASFVGASTICDGTGALLTTSGFTTGVLQLSNNWEMSTNNINWTPIVGANLPTFQTGNMTAGTYYFRYSTTCLVSSQTATSNVLTLQVLAPPTVVITAPNGGAFCGTQTLTASGASTYVWSPASSLSATTGTSVTYTATSNSSVTVTGTDANGCVATSAPLAITFTAPAPITASASIANFCGTGGTTVITASSTATYTYTFTGLNGATISNVTGNSADATITNTSAIRVDGFEASSGCAAQGFVSVGVYPLPAANLTTDVNGVCPGTNANINTGLSAGNFTVTSTTYAPSTAPANAGVIMNNGIAVTPLSGGSMDDGGWGGIPIGFNFNYFGNSFNTIAAGTNGLLMFGTVPGYGTAAGQLGQFTFQGPPYFPNTGNPGNIIALLAADMQMANSTTGSIKYWTEGYAPNRVFVIEYKDVRGWSSNPNATVQCKLYETLGQVEVHLTEKTFTNNAIIGLQDATQTVGAVAPGRAGTWTVTTPEAWRFTPPSNYTTVWTQTNTGGTTQIASGTNIFTQAVSPSETTIYNISYTNQTTGCSNAVGSAQVTISVLGTVAPAGITATSSVPTICNGIAFDVSTNYTGITDGLTFQWQVSTDNGQAFFDIPGATTITYTTSQSVASIYQLKIVSCGGTPITTAPVSVPMSSYQNCYCTPTYTTGTTAGDLISNVEIVGTTLINNSGFVAGTPSYVFYTGQPNYTANLLPSSTYIVNVSTGEWGDEGVAAWIDYNDDGAFDISERIGATPTTIGNGYTPGQVNDSSSFTISLACTPPTGIHRMRVRMAWLQDGVNIDPCATYAYGETEDYLVNILPPPTCPSPGILTIGTATTTSIPLTWALGCSTASTFDVEYGPTGFTPGTGTLVSSVTPTLNGTNASYTLTGLIPNTSYSVYLRANCGNGDVSIWSTAENFSTLCAPISLNNSGAQVVCSSYTLPSITEVTPSNNADLQSSYFTQPNGTGFLLTGAITTSQTVYVYAQAGSCVAQENFTVTVNQPSTSSTTLTQCSSYAWNGQTYTTSGTYTYTTQNAVNCDSTATLILTITQPTTSTLNVLACQSYVLNGQTYTASGTYTQTIQNAVGCDSTITLNLTIGVPQTNTVNVTQCDSYSWNGTTYTTSGQYQFTYQNIYGCDSVVTLNLTINNSSSSSTTYLSCTPYTWNGQTYTASGTYVYNTQNAIGCDSTATLILTIGNNGSTSTATTCGSFTWTNGQTYTASGTYTQTLTNVNGCDSVLTLNLTINPLPTATATDNGSGVLTSSTGTSYQWIDCATNTPIAGATQQTYTATENGSYAVIVTNASNCSKTSTCVVVDYIGLDENGDLSLNVYPNPTTGNMNIAINGTTANYNVSVEDMNGRIVAEFGQLIHGNGVYNLNLTKVVTGVYFIKLKNGLEQRTVRVIVQ